MDVARHAQSTQNRKLEIFLQYIKKRNIDKFIFCMQVNMKNSCKVIPTFWVCFARPSQSSHNFSVWFMVMQQKVAISN